MIISKTPLRMSFVGGGSDLPAFYREEVGAVLSTSIDQYMYLCVNRKFDRKVRLSYSRTEEVDAAVDLEHPLAREALALVGIEGGIEIASMSDIPSRGSGLGSSSTYTVGLLNALYAYRERHRSKADLAREACEIEIDRCGEPIGKQDQYAASFGGLNLIRFHPDESVSVDPVVCSTRTAAALEQRTLVFFTGRTRSASLVLAEQSLAISQGDRRLLMRRMVELAFELKRALEVANIAAVGPLLDENWSLKKQMSGAITDMQIDNWYATAMANGAEGGKLLGAGNGGFLMLHAPVERHDGIAAALPGLERVRFGFDRVGTQILYYQPSPSTP